MTYRKVDLREDGVKHCPYCDAPLTLLNSTELRCKYCRRSFSLDTGEYIVLEMPTLNYFQMNNWYFNGTYHGES